MSEYGDDQPVLLVDGEELVGAKQNRVLNLTILAPAHSAFTIPVSCVEAGRWAHTSRQFSSSAQAYFAAGRANKMAQVSESLVTRGVRRSDQQAVWAGIAEKAARFKTASSTGAMYDIFQDHAKRIDDYVTAFTSQDEQVGAAFAINGQIIGVELLDCAPTWQKLLPKLVRSYALDAIDAPAAKRSAVSSAAVKRFLAAIKKAEAKTFPAVGEGVDVRLTAANLRAAGLVANGRVVHLNARSDLNAAQKRASHADEKARNKRNSNLQGEARGSARGREPAAQGLNLPAVALRAWRLTRVMNVNSRC